MRDSSTKHPLDTVFFYKVTLIKKMKIVPPCAQQILAKKQNFSGYTALAVGITYFGAKTVRQNSKIDSSSGLGDFQTAAI